MISAFSHDSYLKAPSLCLAKFDELSARYDAKDMFGNPLSTDLFGNVVDGKKKGKRG